MPNLINKIILMSALILLACESARAVDTKIKGDTMNVENKGETITFKGHVRLDRGEDRVRAREMSTNKTRDKVTAVGDVDLYRKVSATETIQGFGARGFYDTKLGGGKLWGNGTLARVIHTTVVSSTMSRVADIFADRFDVKESGADATAYGRVYGKTQDPVQRDVYEFWSDQADYNGPKKIMTLTGTTQPKVKQNTKDGTRIVTGDVITYDMESKRVKSTGNASAFFEDRREKESQQKK